MIQLVATGVLFCGVSLVYASQEPTAIAPDKTLDAITCTIQVSKIDAAQKITAWSHNQAGWFCGAW
jgi:hypothetical protein